MLGRDDLIDCRRSASPCGVRSMDRPARPGTCRRARHRSTRRSAFEGDGKSYGVSDPDDDWGTATIDERSVHLDTIATVGSSISYMYDFGDGWDHRITVEKVLPTSDTPVPPCIGARRACPPEDCGGPWGHGDLLVILADSTHPEHRERAGWLGRPFAPRPSTPTISPTTCERVGSPPATTERRTFDGPAHERVIRRPVAGGSSPRRRATGSPQFGRPV